MDKKLLLNISYLLAFTGLSVLFIINKISVIEKLDINKIDNGYLDKTVKISGIITSVKSFDTVSFLTIKDNTGSISVTFFKSGIIFNINDLIIIEGKVTKYNKKLEILADSIKII